MKWDIPEREPILGPQPGWKKGFVYALDVRKVGEHLYMYFNARDGWLMGRENVGLAFGTRPGARRLL
jgi:hypothetical protein